MCKDSPKCFKGKYSIFFYDEDDEHVVAFFDTIADICRYKRLEFTPQNYNLVKTELYRALKKNGHKTWMLTGRLMHVHLVDISEDENQEEML